MYAGGPYASGVVVASGPPTASPYTSTIPTSSFVCAGPPPEGATLLDPVREERIVEVIKERVENRIIEVPEVHYVEKIVEVPHPVFEEKLVHIVKPLKQERFKYVKKPVYLDKIVEVPQIKYVDKYVDVPRYNHREKIVEVPKVLVVERIIPVLKTFRKETAVYVGEDVSQMRIPQQIYPQDDRYQTRVSTSSQTAYPQPMPPPY
ncbi:alveolin domain containing intermediate filament IMC8 [Besnoitia besnoiti]|uniref:Alveolin domain containing intermediate filament IMC8 n=1 Tax=Besnoitia besnoiti TaxID=94643 RepID=A0A2A9MDQ2_BESBE|nr:alveolin domain containing intermediate filament IMC8 [Besnoitia besnoiti]PFH35324.1 alveolin domain containing intermediate filament IMC8 [Besnoitia besnoiti]